MSVCIQRNASRDCVLATDANVSLVSLGTRIRQHIRCGTCLNTFALKQVCTCTLDSLFIDTAISRFLSVLLIIAVEARLDKLEQQLQEQTRDLASHLASCDSSKLFDEGTTSRPLLSGHPPVIPSYDSQRQSSVQSGYRATIDSTLQPQARHSSHQVQQVQNAQSQNQYTPFSQSHPLASPIAPTATPGWPPYDLLYNLTDLFFHHVNCWLPLLDRKTTLDRLFGTIPLDEADKVLLHAFVVVSLRFSNDVRLTPESKEHYHNISKRRVQLFCLENSSVRSLQALAILAIDVTGNTNGPEGWNLIGLASRSVVQLGLAVETTSSLTASAYPSISTLRAAVLPEAKNWIENEERRRLFWAIYLLDRYTTVATAFEFALNDQDIERRLPCRDDLFARNQEIDTRFFNGAERSGFIPIASNAHGHFSSLVEVLGILSSIHRFLKRPVDINSSVDVERWRSTYRSLDSELNAWHFNQPDDFVSVARHARSKTAISNHDCGWITVYAAFCLAVIRLNSSAAYPSQTSPLFSSSYSAMQRCLSAVDQMRRLASTVQAGRMLDRLGHPFAFCIWVCARVTLVHGSTMDHEVDPDLGLFVSVLVEMGHQWDVSRRYGDILSRVHSEYQQSRHAIDYTGGRPTPSTVSILADMRRCAYDLDFLISRQPQNAVRSYQPTRVNSPQPNELEYLDVFDLFNFPRLPVNGFDDPVHSHAVPVMPQSSTALASGPMNPEISSLQLNFSVPNPDEDWLFQPQ